MSEEKFSFEEAMSELESIVKKMEEENLPLDESLKEYENGIAIIRKAKEYLGDAEKHLMILTEGTKE